MKVPCFAPGCKERRRHHEDPDTPRGVQHVEVPDDWPGIPVYCSMTCAIMAGYTGLAYVPEGEGCPACAAAGVKVKHRYDFTCWRVGKTTPPWTADQVASLNAYQACGYCHPFTYDLWEYSVMGRGFGAVTQVDLIATPDGWVCEPGGPVVQRWAHAWMADWSWRRPKYPPDTEHE